MSGEEVVQLFLHFALTLRVFGQEVAGEAQRVAARLVPGHEEDERLAHDLVLADGPLLRTRRGRLLLVAAFVLVLLGWRVLCLRGFVPEIGSRLHCVKVFQRHVLLACPCVQHQLEEVPTPLRAKKLRYFSYEAIVNSIWHQVFFFLISYYKECTDTSIGYQYR